MFAHIAGKPEGEIQRCDLCGEVLSDYTKAPSLRVWWPVFEPVIVRHTEGQCRVMATAAHWEHNCENREPIPFCIEIKKGELSG